VSWELKASLKLIAAELNLGEQREKRRPRLQLERRDFLQSRVGSGHMFILWLPIRCHKLLGSVMRWWGGQQCGPRRSKAWEGSLIEFDRRRRPLEILAQDACGQPARQVREGSRVRVQASCNLGFKSTGSCHGGGFVRRGSRGCQADADAVERVQPKSQVHIRSL
jgi:hypothetical protein